MSASPRFSGGRNLAEKVPPHLYEAMVRFYRYVSGFKPVRKHAPAIVFEFGARDFFALSVKDMARC